MNAKPPSRTADQFVVRLPDGMRERIAEAAKASGRSMNAEIVARLQESFVKPSSAQEVTIMGKVLDQRMQDMDERLEVFIHQLEQFINAEKNKNP